MLKRLLKWNAERRAWNRDHEAAWAGAAEPTDSGLSRFQIRCEPAIANALSGFGMTLGDRCVEGTSETFVKARLAGTDWTLWIYPDGAEVSSDESTLVRMEKWDARSPEEFIATFVEILLERLQK